MNDRASPEPVVGAAASLLAAVGLEPTALEVQAPAQVLPSVFRVDVAAGAAVAALSAAVAQLARHRTDGAPGPAPAPGAVTVNGRAAQIAFRSERYLRVDGQPPADPWAALSGDYRTADGWIRVHANFAHHATAAATALGVAAPVQRPALEAALRSVPSVEAESAIVAAGGVAAALRSLDAWSRSGQALADRAYPVVRLGVVESDAAPRPWPRQHRDRDPAFVGGALDGLRVLDLTRVIAGPVCGRVLAAHGAEVLAVTAAHLPQIQLTFIDTGFGKRSTFLDLRQLADRRRFEALVRGADALVQSYRPGALSALGYSSQQLAELSPGLVITEVRAYGSGGPWAQRRGFDSLVQSCSGIAHTAQHVAGAERPVSLPCQALDHASGWLAALGTVAGWLRQRGPGGAGGAGGTGGSWQVEVSLSATAAWLIDLGRDGDPTVVDPGPPDVEDLLRTTPSRYGLLRHVAMVGALNAAPLSWRTPPPLPGSSEPTWSPQPRL
ncbi:MAG: CoA transferase [Acidimicrobiales bacterium]